jgi:polyisoprenoid-binding protein YceI
MRILKWLALAVVVVVGVAFAGWYFFLKSDPEPRAAIEKTKVVEPETSAVSGSTGTTKAGAGALDGTYTVAPGNSSNFVGYRVTEKLFASVAQSTATGRTDNVTGTLTISGTTINDVTVSADLRNLTSDNSLRDGRVREQGLESNRFPQAKFVLTTPITLAALPAAGDTIKVDGTGDFTLHGVTKKVTIPLEARWDGKAIQVVGTLPVVFGDYNITAPSSPLVASIDDHAEMEFKLFFAKA